LEFQLTLEDKKLGAVTTSHIAQELAKKQKEISISEFFERNKHILGFDSAPRALLTTVKEAVDNSLDACEEAGILPDINVEIQKNGGAKDEYVITIEDNGPGIVKKQIAQIYGRLLYGSRFHSIRQSRGQQGIGISAAVMYGQLTTGRAARIISKIGEKQPAYRVDLILDTKKNRPEVIYEDVVLWDKQHGTRIEVTVRGKYVRERKQSVFEYIRSTAIVNPHAQLVFKEPDGTVTAFERISDMIPKPTEEIQPHPHGIELGILMKMAKSTDKYKMTSFLTNEFSRVSPHTAKEILKKSEVPTDLKPQDLSLDQAKALIDTFPNVKIMAPPTDCLSPIGDTLIKKGLKNVLEGLRPDFYAPPVTRDPVVYAGNPFQVEVGIVFGGELSKDSQVEILRFANRVPLLYQQGGCVTTKAIESVDWRNYGLEQRGGKGIPVGPAIIMVHVASTNVPFTSESKEAIADIIIIRKEIENALKLCARKLRTHLKKAARRNKIKEKFDIVQKLLPALAEKSAEIVGKPAPSLDKVITQIMEIVLIEDNIEFENDRHKVKIEVKNYTTKGRKFRLILEVPDGEGEPELVRVKVENIQPKPTEVKANRIIWDLKNIPSAETFELKAELVGLDKDEYDETEIYFEGIDPIHIVGAEPWQDVE
jgi:DNA topoisomerase-6 subunit B